MNTVIDRSIQLKGKEFHDKLTVCQFAKRTTKIHGVPGVSLRYIETISSYTSLKHTFQAHFNDQEIDLKMFQANEQFFFFGAFAKLRSATAS